MHFTQSPPIEFDFGKNLDELVFQIKNHLKREIRPMHPDQTWLEYSHKGIHSFGKDERFVAFTEREGSVLEFTIQNLRTEDSFLGAPLTIGVDDFRKFLDQKSIPWSLSWGDTLFLYENWMAFFIEDSLISSILWYNPEVMPYLELLDLAFPPKS